MVIPKFEIDFLTTKIKNKPEYFNPEYISKDYKKYCKTLIKSPFSQEIVNPIKQALIEGVPYSVIRIGDGEANLLTYSCYPNTPKLNRYVADKIISMQEDKFKTSHNSLLFIQRLMLGSITNANLIGLIGIWRPHQSNPERLIKKLTHESRGPTGHWRGIDYMLACAKNKQLINKILAPAHLYFSILDNLDELLNLTSCVYVISDNSKNKLFNVLRTRYNHIRFHMISIGFTKSELMNHPKFLTDTLQKLPAEMLNSLTLVAAGPWSEIYCHWVKLKGGVAVDIGSGIDLLSGKITRPIHTKVKSNKVLEYDLISKADNPNHSSNHQ